MEKAVGSAVASERDSEGKMKERGILMTAENALATQEGRKTMTRRVMNPQPPMGYIYKGDDGGNPHLPKHSGHYWMNGYAMWRPRIKYAIGDRLYLKEPHYWYGAWVKDGTTKTGRQKWRFIVSNLEFNFRYVENPPLVIRANQHRILGWYKRSPLFMPKRYARHWYVITGIGAERLQDISEKDAWAEGLQDWYGEQSHGMPYSNVIRFANHWDSINAARGYSWESNPWCWPIRYEVVK